MGDKMKVYWDLLFILNFAFDFILLLAVSLILRRRCKLKRLILGALLGALSIFLLFIKINSIELFIIKLLVSVIMCVVSFSYKNFKYFMRNMMYLYMTSIVLGGFLYLLNVEFSYKQSGLVFYHNGLSINFVILIICSPIIIYLYVKQSLMLKNNYSSYYDLNISLNGNIIKLTGFLDTGNKLVEPITKRPIILVSKEKLKNVDFSNSFEVNYSSLNNTGSICCINAEVVNVVGLGIKKNILIGVSNDNFHIDGVDCILNTKLMEELC